MPTHRFPSSLSLFLYDISLLLSLLSSLVLRWLLRTLWDMVILFRGLGLTR